MKRSLKLILAGGGGLLVAGAALGWLADDVRGNQWAVSVIRTRFPEVMQIRPQTLTERLNDLAQIRPVILDARSAEEFAVSHLPGAIHLDVETVSEDDLVQLDSGKPYVVYCSAGYRSCQLARKLTKHGLADVKNLEGGIFAWANEGYPVYRGAEAVHVVHPYHALFSRLLKPGVRQP